MDQPDLNKILSIPAAVAARRLLGCELVREIDGKILSGKIVETEAYHQADVASHSYSGMTPRTKVMFGPAGFLYVYFTYGMHYCCNIVTGADGEGSAVLIRALEPTDGRVEMSLRRNGLDGQALTNGPAKLCQALGIDKKLNGHNLKRQPLQLIINDKLNDNEIVKSTRIGISRARDAELRFYIKNNPYVSRT